VEREELEAMLGEGLSIDAVAQRLGCHPDTVSSWLRRYGMQPNGAARHAPRGALDRDVLTALVQEGLSVRQIAARVDRSYATVRHWLREYGLQTARASGRHGVPRLCPIHGTTEFFRRPDGGLRCAACRVDAVVRRRRKVKDTLVREAGGRCELCGYDRYVGALQFHRRDPGQKRFSISQRGVTRSLERARAEASKCVLLCANCHAEVEGGTATLPPDPRGELGCLGGSSDPG
jgi:transposase